MTSTVTYAAYTADKLRSVRAEWNKTPFGTKRDNAKRLYDRALKAHNMRRDEYAIEQLDALIELLAE